MAKDEKIDASMYKTQIDYLTASLIDFFRDPKNESKHVQAAKIAGRHVHLHLGSPHNLDRRFLYLAGPLKNNLTPQSLRHFAQECFLAITSSLSKMPESIPDDSSFASLKKRTSQNLSLAIASGLSESSAVNKTALYLVKQKRKADYTQRIKNLAQKHPLRDVFSACNIAEKSLPKEDIKQKFLHLEAKNDHKSVLLGLLTKAQAFSAPRLHSLLGDDLFFLCRPVGFFDAQETTLLIEVPSNAHLHALAYRKLEIQRLLKKDLAFQKIRSIRFKVMNTIF